MLAFHMGKALLDSDHEITWDTYFTGQISASCERESLARVTVTMYFLV